MNILQLILYTSAAICIIVWLRYLLFSAYHGASIRQLNVILTYEITEYPLVSVIVASRNEEEMIERSLRSILHSSYPNLELIVVNDRSDDNTGRIIDRVASEDARVKALHIDHLPKGWLGKVNALNVGKANASGQWLLFTDADIHFEPEAIVKAVAFVSEKNIDHLSVIPTDRTQHNGFFLPLFIFSFGGLFVQRIKAREIGKKGSDAYVGVGAFNFVKRSVFETTKGFEWLKMEVVDDAGVGLLMHNVGASAAIVNGEGLLSFEWYPSLIKAVRGLEKNAFGAFANYNVFYGLVIVIRMWAVIFLPFLVSLFYGDFYSFAVSIFLYSLLPGMSAVVLRKGIGIKPQIAASLPLGYLFLSFAILNSVYYGWRNGGLQWRDTFYSVEELRKGKRVKL